MSRLPVKLLSKVQNFCGIAALQIWPYLGASKCWEHCVLQTPALVTFLNPFRSDYFLESILVCFGLFRSRQVFLASVSVRSVPIHSGNFPTLLCLTRLSIFLSPIWFDPVRVFS